MERCRQQWRQCERFPHAAPPATASGSCPLVVTYHMGSVAVRVLPPASLWLPDEVLNGADTTVLGTVPSKQANDGNVQGGMERSLVVKQVYIGKGAKVAVSEWHYVGPSAILAQCIGTWLRFLAG